MIDLRAWHQRIALAMAGRKNPWGDQGDKEGGASAPETPAAETPPTAEPEGTKPEAMRGDGPRKSGPRNPWLPSGDERGPARKPGFDEMLRARMPRGGGGGGGGFPRLPERGDGKSWWPLIVGGVLALWLMTSSFHSLAPQEKGVVTTFGSYSRTLDPGVSTTLPWPLQKVAVTDVTSIRRETMPDGDAERLMLTGDQNLVDLSYIVRWNIKDLKLYQFQLRDPQDTVKEVAEAAMRATIAEVSLNDAMGSGRATIESRVRERMQAILDAYRSGVRIQGVEIKKTDPPARVVDAFKAVLAAQQDAQSDINRARAWAQQITARAQGEAAAFDKVYGQYKEAPEVTRRRMYYETMERVLSQNDKVIVEAPGGVTSYLPLPEVKRREPAAEASGGAGQ